MAAANSNIINSRELELFTEIAFQQSIKPALGNIVNSIVKILVEEGHIENYDKAIETLEKKGYNSNENTVSSSATIEEKKKSKKTVKKLCAYTGKNGEKCDKEFKSCDVNRVYCGKHQRDVKNEQIKKKNEKPNPKLDIVKRGIIQFIAKENIILNEKNEAIGYTETSNVEFEKLNDLTEEKKAFCIANNVKIAQK